MPFILRRKFGLTANYITTDTIVVALHAAYSIELLKQTQLYQAMIHWGISHNKKILLQ